MQIHLNRLSQLVLTTLGLLLLAIAAMLNHYHPHNQGIADINQRSIYQKLGISSASSGGFANLSYAKILPAATTKDKNKIQDPTESTPDNSAALPQAPMAGDQAGDVSSSTQSANPDQQQTQPAKSNVAGPPQDTTKS